MKNLLGLSLLALCLAYAAPASAETARCGKADIALINSSVRVQYGMQSGGDMKGTPKVISCEKLENPADPTDVQYSFRLSDGQSCAGRYVPGEGTIHLDGPDAEVSYVCE